jgi:hypothetical protein
MNLPQIRQGRMVLKGTQFPLLQPLAEPGPDEAVGKLVKTEESLIDPKASSFLMNNGDRQEVC